MAKFEAILLLACALQYNFISCIGYTLVFDEKIPLSSQIVHPYVENAILRTLPAGETATIRCPGGSVLNNCTVECEFLKNSQARTLNTFNMSGTGANNALLTKTTALPNKEDCKSFILSGPSGSHVMQCSANLLFNSEISSCDYPYNANCCEYWEKANTFF